MQESTPNRGGMRSIALWVLMLPLLASTIGFANFVFSHSLTVVGLVKAGGLGRYDCLHPIEDETF